MERRAFLQRIGLGGAVALGTGCIVAPGPGTGGGGKVNEAWEDRATLLEESSGVTYSAAAPGIWTGKEGAHAPTVTVNTDGSVSVANTHPMEEGHWVTTMFVRDQDGAVIHLVDFTARGTNKTTVAATTFTPPAGTTAVTAYAYCNLHDLWMSELSSLG